MHPRSLEVTLLTIKLITHHRRGSGSTAQAAGIASEVSPTCKLLRSTAPRRCQRTYDMADLIPSGSQGAHVTSHDETFHSKTERSTRAASPTPCLCKPTAESVGAKVPAWVSVAVTASPMIWIAPPGSVPENQQGHLEPMLNVAAANAEG